MKGNFEPEKMDEMRQLGRNWFLRITKESVDSHISKDGLKHFQGTSGKEGGAWKLKWKISKQYSWQK